MFVDRLDLHLCTPTPKLHRPLLPTSRAEQAESRSEQPQQDLVPDCLVRVLPRLGVPEITLAFDRDRRERADETEGEVWKPSLFRMRRDDAVVATEVAAGQPVDIQLDLNPIGKGHVPFQKRRKKKRTSSINPFQLPSSYARRCRPYPPSCLVK